MSRATEFNFTEALSHTEHEMTYRKKTQSFVEWQISKYQISSKNWIVGNKKNLNKYTLWVKHTLSDTIPEVYDAIRKRPYQEHLLVNRKTTFQLIWIQHCF